MNPQWKIELLGGLAACRDEERTTRFATQKTAALLAYLAFYRKQPHPRETLIELLWPECELSSGRTRLSTLLSYLRNLLEPPGTEAGTVVQADRTTVRLNPDAVTTDVAEFERLVQHASRIQEAPKRLELLQRAIALYKGELLPGSYEDWIGSEQSRLNDRFAEALQELGLAYEQAGEIETALTTMERAIKADRYREAAYRTKMRLLAALGRPAAVKESYVALERLFQEELGTGPSAATRELAERLQREPRASIQEREATYPAATLAASRSPKRLSLPDAEALSETASPTTLPLQMTRFFGRTQELAALRQIFLETDSRLVTVTGTGGAGKTRLAIEAGRKLAPVLKNRIWYVPLADLPDVRLLSYALARALKVSVTDTGDPLESILTVLNEAPGLLVLDNFEHLLREEGIAAKGDQVLPGTGPALIRLLLERAPSLRCLVTSQRPLRLSGEQEFPLKPLPLPPLSSPPEEALASDSVSLYVDRAKLARPDFALTVNNAEIVARLCRRLEGMPLAIEMAAAWAKALPPARMLERLEERLDVLTSRQRDVPTRHQSLRATMDWSYGLLDASHQRLLARLSVFRGGWTLEAAEAICCDDSEIESEEPERIHSSDVLGLLTGLVEKSLVVYEEADEEERYRLLETVRQYSGDRLRECGTTARVQARHVAFFRDMAEASWNKIRGPEQIACLNTLEREHENMRAALIWAGTEEGRRVCGDEAELDLAGWLRLFWDMRGYWREGRERLEAALRRGTKRLPTGIWANVLLGAGVLAANMSDYAVAREHYEACLTIRRQLGDTQGIGSVAMGLGNLAREEGDYPVAHRWYAESLKAARQLENKWFLAAVLTCLGVLAECENDLAARQEYHQEALMIRRQIGDHAGIAIAQHNLSLVYTEQQDFPAAYASTAESLTLLQKVGDKRVLVHVLAQLAILEKLQERTGEAALLFGAVQRIMEEIGAGPDPRLQEQLDEVQKAIGAEAFLSAVAQGHQMEFDQALEHAQTILQHASIKLSARKPSSITGKPVPHRRDT